MWVVAKDANSHGQAPADDPEWQDSMKRMGNQPVKKRWAACDRGQAASRGYDGHSAMHLAARFGHGKCVKVLAKRLPDLVKAGGGGGVGTCSGQGR